MNLEKTIVLRLTKKDHDKLLKKALAKKQTLSAFIRTKLLKKGKKDGQKADTVN